jgi:hypothetical protein
MRGRGAPAAALKLELVPSPHVTVTVYGPCPENEPRLKVTFAPSFADWLAPGVTVSGGGATTESRRSRWSRRPRGHLDVIV